MTVHAADRARPSATSRAEIASFGPVHLEVTDLVRSTAFWREVVGLVVRTSGDVVEMGTGSETLVVLHGGATRPFQHRHSGLYHLAVHPPTEADFARILLRIIERRWPVSPTDHTMSKALYLEDPDGITVEITLETPERMRSMTVHEHGIDVVDADGFPRSGRDPLDVRQVLSTLTDRDTTVPVPVGTKIGHVHLYVGDLDAAYRFYAGLGFNPAVYAPQFGMGDLGAGGRFNHRIAVNTWQGVGAPPSPAGTARMRHFTIRFDTYERLDAIVATLDSRAAPEGHLVHDPAGNAIVLTGPVRVPHGDLSAVGAQSTQE